MKRHGPIPRIPDTEITIEVDGRSYKGRYRLEGRMLHLTSKWGDKVAPFGRRPADVLARQLLTELVREAASPAP